MRVQEQEQSYELQRKKRLKEKKRKRKIRFIKFLFTLVLLTVTIVLLLTSSVFNITLIEVRGSSRYTSDDIIMVTDLVTGNNAFKSMGNNIDGILRFRYIAAEERIKGSYPYVRDAVVKYIIPGKVIISITEREPKYIVSKDGISLLMDGEGFIVDSVGDAKSLKLPVIKGLKFERFEVGQALKADDSKSLKSIIKLMKGIEESDGNDAFKLWPLINYIDVNDLSKVSVMVENRLLVNYGDLQDLNYRIGFSKQIYQKGLSKQEKGTLDFSLGDDPRFLPGN